MKSNIQIITTFISEQMDGESVPTSNSEALAQLSSAISEIQKHQSGQELQALALHVIRAVIDRVSGNIQAQQTLQQFLQGGNHA